MELDLDDKPRAAVNEKMFTPRTWFFGGFTGVFVASIVQIIISGVILNQLSDHHDDVTGNATGPASSPASGGSTGSLVGPAGPAGPAGPVGPVGPAATTESLHFFNSERQVWADANRPPGFNMDWSKVVEAARGTTVTFAAQLAFAGPNYIAADGAGFLAEELKRKFDITLNILDLPAGESTKQAVEQADIDFIWLNKDKYIYLRDQQNTWGPYAASLPNGALFDFTDPVISTDFGIPTNGEEMPFHIANFVMAYDKDNIPTVTTGSWPPKNIGELVQQVNDGEVIFHPATPGSFLGTPFLEQVFYHYVGYEEGKKFREEFDETWWLEQKDKVFPVLKKFHENLYVNSVTTLDADGNEVKEDFKYSSPPTVRTLFNEGKVHLTAEYAPGAVFNRVEAGTYPEGTVSFLFEERMVSNTNFLTIPGNAPNKAGAMVAINLASSLEHQYKRFIPNDKSWKALQAFNPFKAIVKQTGFNTVFDEIEQLEGAPTVEEMAVNRVGEFNEAYWARMKEDFAAEIGFGVNPIS